MDDRVMEIFMMELVELGKAMEVSAERYKASIGAPPGSEGSGTTQPFLAAQSMLTTGALVSKTLTVSPPKRKWCKCDLPEEDQRRHALAKQRCKALKKALGVKGDYPRVIKSRKVRNTFEHFDNELDEFFADNPSANYFDRNIGPRSAYIVGGQPAPHMRFIDNTSHTVSVLEREVALYELADAVLDIAKRARQWLHEHGIPI